MYTILGTTIAIEVTFTFLFALGLIEKGEPHEKENIANSDSIDTHNEHDGASQGE